MQSRLRASLDEEVFGGSSKRKTRRRVRYNDEINGKREQHYNPGLVKEEIEIPDPGPRRISRTEHTLAAIMSGGERQMHGLTGRPLV